MQNVPKHNRPGIPSAAHGNREDAMMDGMAVSCIPFLQGLESGIAPLYSDILTTARTPMTDDGDFWMLQAVWKRLVPENRVFAFELWLHEAKKIAP